MSNTILAVYGTLRQGQCNHHILKDSKFLGTHKLLVPARMISYTAFPALIKSHAHNVITAELYEVSPEVMVDVDALEGVPHLYQRMCITDTAVHESPITTYVQQKAHSAPQYYQEVYSGDWVRWKKHSALSAALEETLSYYQRGEDIRPYVYDLIHELNAGAFD